MPAIGSVDELLARASSRTEVRPGDGKAGARYERVLAGGEPFFVKQLSPASDWIMRVTGDHVHRPYLVWRSGIMGRSPGCIDHTVVAMQVSGTGDDAVLTMVMRDVGACLVPEGDTVVPASQHAGFIEHMADLACAFWGWDDDIGLTTMEQRLRFFAPDNIAAELLAADVPPPIAAADAGWRALPRRSPVLSGLARLIHDQPDLVTGPLAATPRTFLHGDWKMGNLGTAADGRTILLDWAYPGEGPIAHELGWYLALNRARLPQGHTKESTIADFRAALERHGITTEPWWERQLGLCLLGTLVQFGWEKALGDDDELHWWIDRAREGTQWL
jgi:hypothetical protein